MKYFTAVVECGSFTEAAEQCYISQSAISQQIRALEKELGVELIHRENRKFTLTPAGEYFYSRSKGLLEEADDIRRETVRIGQDDELQLRIGYLRCYSGQQQSEQPGVSGTGQSEADPLYPDLFQRTAEYGAGLFSEHSGIRRPIPVRGKPGGRAADGSRKPGIPAD